MTGIKDDPRQQPLRMTDVERAIYRWIVRKSQIVPEMIWGKQQATQPPYPYCSAIWTSIAKEGGRDELRTSTDLSRPLGEEIEMLTTGPRKLVLSLSFHVDREHGGYDPSAYALLLAERARTSLAQQGVLDLLRDVGSLAVVRELGVTDTSVAINGEWLSRATFDVELRATAIATEHVGYIDKVEVAVPTPGLDLVIDAS